MYYTKWSAKKNIYIYIVKPNCGLSVKYLRMRLHCIYFYRLNSTAKETTLHIKSSRFLQGLLLSFREFWVLMSRSDVTEQHTRNLCQSGRRCRYNKNKASETFVNSKCVATGRFKEL